MTPHRILTGLLAVQCALAAYTWYPRDTTVVSEPIVPFEAQQIEEIALASATTRSRGADLVLSRRDEGWVVASENDFPAREAPVQELIDRLLSLERGRPITGDPSLHAKLNVSAETPTRRVVLRTADQQLEFLAGTASRERMNVRFPAEDEVYEVGGLGAWRMSDNARTYLVTQPFEKPGLDTVTAVTLVNEHGEIALNHGPNGWISALGEPVVEAEADRIVNKLLSIQVAEVADPSLDPAAAADVTFRWTTADGASHSYHGMKAGEQLVIGLDDGSLPPFRISPVGGQTELLDTTPSDLILPSAPAPEEP